MNSAGYGTLWRRGSEKVLAHRAIYEAVLDAIPEGMQLDHRCQVRRCVNPSHLEPVTGRENVRRSPKTWATRNATKAVCLRGHAFDAVDKHGYRRCLTCERLRHRWSRQQRRESP